MYDIKGIEKTFYFRTTLKEGEKHKYNHTKAFKARFYGRALWIMEVYDEGETVYKDTNILNYRRVHGKGYEYLSDGLINTHIDIYKRDEWKKEYRRAFVYLTRWERFRIAFAFRNTEYHKNPIQFVSVIVATIALSFTAIRSCSKENTVEQLNIRVSQPRLELPDTIRVIR